jgi:hypothetical protein
MSDVPHPDLLAEYGTDEVYLANLEKVAASSIFSDDLAMSGQSEWGRLVAAAAAHEQNRIDQQRLQAAIINRQFRQLETGRMANTIENLGGPGSARQSMTRTMQMRPHMLHPMMLARGGYGGMGMGGGMASPEMLGGMGMPAGTGAYSEPVTRHPEQVMPAGQDDPEMQALDAEMMEVNASVDFDHFMSLGGEFADGMGRSMAHLAWAMEKSAQPVPPTMPAQPGGAAYQSGAHLGQAAGHGQRALKAIKGMAGEAAMGTGSALQGVGSAVEDVGTKTKGVVSSALSGFRDYMSQDVQSTPRWGSGIAPATNVNQYGQPIY